MKTVTKILAIWGCIATLPLLYFLCVYLDSQGIIEFRRQPYTDYYYTADLLKMNLPSWNLTNAIPLSPDAAVRAAMEYATKKHPGITNWEAYRISLDNWETNGIWTYGIPLVDRKSGRYEQEDVRVLMDGTIWKPTQVERK